MRSELRWPLSHGQDDSNERQPEEAIHGPPALLDKAGVLETLRYLIAGIDPETGEVLSDGVFLQPNVKYTLTVALEALTRSHSSGGSNVIPRPRPQKGQTLLDTLELFRNGLSPEQIAVERDLQVSTIYGHLQKLIAGSELRLDEVVSQDIQDEVARAYADGEPPLEVQDVVERLRFALPVHLVGLVLRSLNLQMGRGSSIDSARQSQVEDTIIQAVGSMEGEHRERTIAKILLGAQTMRHHTNGEYPFGELKGYDNQAILDLIDRLLASGKLKKREKKLFVGGRPAPSRRGGLQLTEDDIPF